MNGGERTGWIAALLGAAGMLTAANAGAGVPVGTPADAPAPEGQALIPIDLSARQPQIIRQDDVTVTVRVRADGPGMIVAPATVQVRGRAAVALPDTAAAPASIPRAIGIGKLRRGDPAPSVLMVGYTGGAHCCLALQAVVPAGRRMTLVRFPQRNDGLEAFPRDVDGDGTADFLFSDNRFLYTFSSYAGSFAPPQILNIVNGRVVDVSTKPGFRPLFEAFTTKARRACTDPANDDRNGACAGYVAGSARLGRYAPAMREASRFAYNGKGLSDWLPTGCAVKQGPTGCPKGREIRFRAFPDALRWFLKDSGYIR